MRPAGVSGQSPLHGEKLVCEALRPLEHQVDDVFRFILRLYCQAFHMDTSDSSLPAGIAAPFPGRRAKTSRAVFSSLSQRAGDGAAVVLDQFLHLGVKDGRPEAKQGDELGENTAFLLRQAPLFRIERADDRNRSVSARRQLVRDYVALLAGGIPDDVELFFDRHAVGREPPKLLRCSVEGP